jgi:competence protein ComEC
MRLAILAFVAGVALLEQQALLVPQAPPFLLALALTGSAALLWRRGVFAAKALLVCAAVAAGFAWANALAASRLAQRLTPQWEGRDIVVTGVIADLPRADERATRFLIDVDTTAPALASSARRIALSWYRARNAAGAAPLPILEPGERWQFSVRLKRPHGSANPFTFDFERWALERNIGATGYVRDKVAPLRLAAFVWRPTYLVDRWRTHIRARFAQALRDQPYAEVLTALAVGDQSGIPAAQWRLFWRSGIGHLISISGLHVTMVAGLVGWAAGWAWRRSARLMLAVPAQRIAILAGAAAALLYAALAGFSVPTQRTVYMLAVVAAAWWFGWRAAPSQVLCAALLAVVVLDPWAVAAAGFWLSFGAVAAIFYVTAERPGRVPKAAIAVRTQIAVTLALAPLLLLMFHQLPLVSPIANAIAIPLVSLVVVPLTLAGAALPVDVLLHGAHAIFSAGMSVMQWLTHWPGTVWTRAAPPLWTVALALAGALWLLLPRGFPARWLGVLWLLPLFDPHSERPATAQAWVSVLDVGQGLAVVVETARHTLLYDAGPRYAEDANAGMRIVLPYLRGRGVTRLDGLIVSHADEDHAGGALDIQQELQPPWLLSSLPLEHALTRAAAKTLRCTQGQSWFWDGVRFDVLSPRPDAYAQARTRENALSCVVRVSAGAQSMLLPGDIEAAQERALVARYGAALHSNVLVASHHGSKTSSTAEFLRAVRADAVVFTVGYRNRFQHPHPDVLRRVQASGAHVARSDRNGAVMLRLGAAPLQLQTWRQQAPRYWRAD